MRSINFLTLDVALSMSWRENIRSILGRSYGWDGLCGNWSRLGSLHGAQVVDLTTDWTIEATRFAWSPALMLRHGHTRLHPTMSRVPGNARDALGVDDLVDQRFEVVHQLHTLILERTILDEEPNGIDSQNELENHPLGIAIFQFRLHPPKDRDRAVRITHIDKPCDQRVDARADLVDVEIQLATTLDVEPPTPFTPPAYGSRGALLPGTGRHGKRRERRTAGHQATRLSVVGR